MNKQSTNLEESFSPLFVLMLIALIGTVLLAKDIYDEVYPKPKVEMYDYLHLR